MFKDKLYFITNAKSEDELLYQVEKVIEGGCKLIQLRYKNIDEATLINYGKKVQKLCKENNAKLIVNDSIIAAKELVANGVHLGKNDIHVSEARKMLGSDFIIGSTANTIDDIEINTKAGADYIGLGPFRFTETKENLSPVLGLVGVQNILTKLLRREIHIPLYLIGGIKTEDIKALKNIGINRIAISSEITGTDNIVEKTKQILKLLEE